MLLRVSGGVEQHISRILSQIPPDTKPAPKRTRIGGYVFTGKKATIAVEEMQNTFETVCLSISHYLGFRESELLAMDYRAFYRHYVRAYGKQKAEEREIEKLRNNK